MPVAAIPQKRKKACQMILANIQQCGSRKGRARARDVEPVFLARGLLTCRVMIQMRAFSALVAASIILASTQSTRAQDAVAPTPADQAEKPVVEALPTAALPATLPPAQTSLSPAQPLMVHERRGGLIASGSVVLGISYGLAFLVGLIELPNSGSSDISCNCQNQAAAFLVPVAGPLLTLAVGPHNATDTKLALVWSGIQAAGLAALIVGLVGHDVPLKPIPTVPDTDFSVIPVVTPEGGMLALRTPW